MSTAVQAVQTVVQVKSAPRLSSVGRSAIAHREKQTVCTTVTFCEKARRASRSATRSRGEGTPLWACPCPVEPAGGRGGDLR